jgi:hypothetical protein
MILMSWKSIATHLDCSVRSAQRWERAGLPVSRPFPGRRAYIVADSESLDSWLRNNVFSRQNDLPRLSELQRSQELRKETRRVREGSRELRKETSHIRKELKERIDVMKSRMAQLQNSAKGVKESWVKWH